MLHILTVLASGLAVVSAYHAPGAQVVGTNPITSPNTDAGVTVGKAFDVKYDGSGFGDKISLLLWRGPGDNLVFLKPIADAVPNTGTFTWTPDSSLEDDVTHYGLQLVSEIDGRFQWSTQFGVSNKGGVPPVVSSAPPAPSSTKASSKPAPPASSAPPASKPPAPPASSAPAPPPSYTNAPPPGSWNPPSGGWTPPKNGTAPSTVVTYTAAPPKPTGYTGPLSNNAGRFTVSAVSAVFALGAAVLLL